jgi:GNAT superfamily N-acetyltransferase
MRESSVEIRRVRPDEWLQLRDTRLRALADAPDAFRTRHEDAVRRTDAWWIDWAIRSAAGDGQAMFLAWDGPEPVGIVGTFVEEGCRWLISLWTDPSTRGRGVGRALVAAVVDFAHASGSAELRLEVRRRNEPARRLYERCGFVETGPAADERVMTRVL